MSDLESQLAGLAGEVSEFGERLATLEARGAGDGGSGGGVDPDEVAELAGQVAELGEQLETTRAETATAVESVTDGLDTAMTAIDHLGAAEGVVLDVSPESWLDADVARAPAFLREVVEWAQQVGPYLDPDPDSTLIECWRRHPAVVQLLADARAMWRWVYRSGQARPLDALDWQLRHWPAIETQIKGLLGDCDKAEEHQEPYVNGARRWSIASMAPDAYEREAQEWAARGGRPTPEGTAAASAGPASADT